MVHDGETQQENIMNENDREKPGSQEYAPENPMAEQKSATPDPDRTDPATLPITEEEISMQDAEFRGEHKISPDHAEPVRVTQTSNDNYIEGKYIDVGGGD